MEGDKLVITLSSGRYALDTRAVAGIIELEKLPFLPGKSGFVAGVISFRNEPVTVVDLKAALGGFTVEEKTGHKIIVLGSGGRLLGADIGASAVSFIWDEQTKGKTTEEKGLYTAGRIYTEDGPVDMIDWQSIFNETARLLAADKHA